MRMLIFAMTAKLLRGAMTAKSMRDSSRSSLNRVSMTEEKLACSARETISKIFCATRNSILRQGPVLDIGQFAAVAPEQSLNQREDELVVEPEHDTRVPCLRVEHGNDGAAFIGFEDIADPLGRHRTDGHIGGRRRKLAQTLRTLRRHAIEDHMQHRHAFNRNAGRIEQRAQTRRRRTSACELDPVMLPAGVTEVPEIVSFSTMSIDGLSFDEIVLRPCSRAICGIAPFMKASKVCLTMK